MSRTKVILGRGGIASEVEAVVTGAWDSWSLCLRSQEAERRECWGAACFLLFLLSLEPWPQESVGYPHLMWFFPLQLTRSRHPLTYVPQGLFPGAVEIQAS